MAVNGQPRVPPLHGEFHLVVVPGMNLFRPPSICIIQNLGVGLLQRFHVMPPETALDSVRWSLDLSLRRLLTRPN